jgi:hypothetical protein
MHMDRSITRAAQAAALFFLAACSQSIKQEYDAKLDRNITRMSGNTVHEQVCLVNHSLQLNAARIEEASGATYLLWAETSGPSYVRPERLTLRIDGQTVTIADPVPALAEAACPENSRSNLNLPVGGSIACRYRENYWFPATPQLLIRLANAREVSVQLEGRDGNIQRRFGAENFENFGDFVAQHVQ